MKKIGILFVVFAALLAFVYFYEIQGVEEREQARQLEQSLLGITREEITSFDIEEPGKLLIRVVREPQGWRIQEPVQSAVDQFVVDAFLRDVSQARKTRTLDEATDRLGEYGLADPRLTITIRAGASNSRKLLIGSEDFSGNQIYAKLESQPQVHLTGKAIYTSADKDLREWRSKTVLDFDQDEVTQIEIRQADRTVRLSKQGADWRLVEPIEDRAGDSEVSSLLSAVKFARIDDFLDEPEADSSYGFDNLSYRFRVRNSESEDWRTLEVGKQQPGQESYFARDPTRPLVFTIRKSVVDKLATEPSQFRDHRVVELKQDGFDELNYRHGDVRFRLVREGSRFTFIEPQEFEGREVPAYKFWYPIQDLKFETIADDVSVETDPRFADPVLTLEFKVGVDVRLYEFAEVSGEIWARQTSTGRAGRVARADFEKIHFAPEQLADPEDVG